MSEEAAASGCYFLSYSRTDERFALRLAKDLRAEGINMWVDQLDIRPSEHWDRAIERAVHACCGLVVILSPRSVASDNVADEISFAIDNRKSVLPVMIEKCVLPLRITRMHMIDATGSYEKALKQCLDELGSGKKSDKSTTAASVAGASIDPEIISAAKQKLTAILGPIAGLLVDKSAARASSAAELYTLLSQHIENEADRARFSPAPISAASGSLPSKPAADRAAISQTEIEQLAAALTKYLGPMAPLVAKRESRGCNSLADLRQKLAGHIQVETDRKEFLRRTGAG